jgi:glycosyltransferase involved in cell wall biosynthesis
LYAGATAFICPSLYEGFGMPVLEAMAAGVPVLTSNTSALPEVSGDAAILIDPTDTQAIAESLVRSANDPTLRRDLIERGLAHVQSFTWERCALSTTAVFQQAMAQSQ